MVRVTACLLLVAVVCPAAGLATRIGAIIRSTPEARQSFWGIRVFDASTGAVLYSLNEGKLFVPASNTKLFTTAAAFESLGPDYRFVTRAEIDAAPDANGRVRELRLIGGGDPNLSARILPYDRDNQGDNPLHVIDAMADAIAAKGVRVIDGDIVGDDTAYEWEPYPEDWTVDDAAWEYGAPVSALTLNDNAFRLESAPAPVLGDPAELTLLPAFEHLTIHNRTRTVAVAPEPLRIQRLTGSRELVISGDLLLNGLTRVDLLAVDDPARFAASALRDALLQRGIRINGGVRAVHRRHGFSHPEWQGVEIARHVSMPISESLRVINKVSQNLHSELVLREIARQKRGIGSRKAGVEEMAAWLEEIGVPKADYYLKDGSGLSRTNLATPRAINAVLLRMYRSPHRDMWIDGLPVGARDGTLEKRFARAVQAFRVAAKTGSISHVSALSGYVKRRDGKTWGFTIMANNYSAQHAHMRKLIDAIALALLR